MAASKVSLMAGFVLISTRIEPAVDKESSGMHAVCTGNGTHPPSRVKQSTACPVCDETHSSHYGFTQRGIERDGQLVVVEADEIAKVAPAPRKGTTGKEDPVQLAFHPREKVYAATVASDSVQNVYPDKGSEKSYAALLHALRTHPDLVAAMIWAPQSVNALWTLEVVGERIVATKRCWPEQVRATLNLAPAEVPDHELEMFNMLVETRVEDFDLGIYTNEAKRTKEELISSKAGVSPALADAVVGSQVPDFLAQIEASLEAAGAKTSKPRAAKKAPAKKAPRKRTAAKKAEPARKEVA